MRLMKSEMQKCPTDKHSKKFSTLFYNNILSNGKYYDRCWLVYCKELDKILLLWL